MHIGYKIGNGKSISAWYDRWCNEGPLSEFITAGDIYNARFSNDSKVDCLIRNGSWCWHRTEFATRVVWKDLCHQGNKVSWNEFV